MNSCGLNWLTRVFLLMNLLEAKVLVYQLVENAARGLLAAIREKHNL
jgi:hypothetical protein